MAQLDGSRYSVAVAPYRIAPLGAHVDHQGGKVLGATINDYSVLAFHARDDGRLTLRSDRYDGPAEFELSDPGPPAGWARYAQGAAVALQQARPLARGLNGYVTGGLIGAGLSSSASVGIAYLLALAAVNHITLAADELIELDRVIENEYLGLTNGVQDQTTIVNGRPDALIHQDTRRREVTFLPHPPTVDEVCWLIAYSGFSRELTSSGFNDRVAECRAAAHQLQEGSDILSDVPVDVYEARRSELPPFLRRRADHYFTEVERVDRGATLWQQGDWEGFGRLMSSSCQSSITQYESGSRPIIDLHEICAAQPGVLGSRFCGGGYGGCVVALVERPRLKSAAEQILQRFLIKYPEKEGIAAAFEAQMVGGPLIIEN